MDSSDEEVLLLLFFVRFLLFSIKLSSGANQKKKEGLQRYLKKETLAQVFSCEFCEISKNIFLQETFWRLFLKCSSFCICFPHFLSFS